MASGTLASQPRSQAFYTSSFWSLAVQRFSGCLTKIRSRNWRMRVSMAYWNKLCTRRPSQSTVCSSLDLCRAYLQAGQLHVNGEGTYRALSRQCACAKILNGSRSSNLKTSVCKNGERRPGESYHMICGTADVTDSRCNSLFTFLSTATEKLKNQNKFQRRGKSYLYNISRFEA